MKPFSVRGNKFPESPMRVCREKKSDKAYLLNKDVIKACSP